MPRPAPAPVARALRTRKPGARYPGLTLRILGRRSPAMGPGRADLLEELDRSGSISAAARNMNMSYRRAWQLIDAMNASFPEPLVVTAVGGKRGGGAQVTELGRSVLARFRGMEAAASAAIAVEVRQFEALMKAPPKPAGNGG
jgi:molybdate transport system regulatory protein